MTTGVLGDAGGPRSLALLDDVSVAGRAAGDLLRWDGSNWISHQPYLFDGNPSSDSTQWNLSLVVGVQIVAFSVTIEDASGNNSIFTGPYINGNMTDADYYCVENANNGSSLTPAARNSPPLTAPSANGYSHIWGAVHRFATGVLIQVQAVEIDSVGNAIHRVSAGEFEGTVPANITQLSFKSDQTNGIDTLSHARVWEPGMVMAA